MGASALLRDMLTKVKKYAGEYQTYIDKNNNNMGFAFDSTLHPLRDSYNGQMVKIHAYQKVDIYNAISLGESFGHNYSIEHCTEGHLMMEDLEKTNAQIVLSPYLGGIGKFEMRNKDLSAPGILEKEVFFCYYH